MVLSEIMNDENLYNKHTELCSKLNLDPETVEMSWSNFQSINRNYTLEGDKLHWLGCAIFDACRAAETPTVNRTILQGNCVNFTSLLRYSNLSFVQFFCNIKKWADMAKLPDDFRKKVKHLEDTFGVAYNTFKEFHPLFSKVFRSPEHSELDQSKQHRNRRQRPVPCNSTKVFEFIWNLFITIKSEDPEYSQQLVKSYHLLYACLDLAFKNAFLADRRDLLNPDFKGLPSDWNNPGFEVPNEAPCLMSQFCRCESMLTDAIHIKTYVCRQAIINLIRQGVLSGDMETLTGFFDPAVFETNFKSIARSYETQLLNKGDFDERIFIAEYRRQLLEAEQALNGSAIPPSPADPFSVDSPRVNTPQGCETPLTGRRYLGPRESHVTSTARLHSMLSGQSAAPSEALVQLFQTCANDPRERISNIVSTLGDKFVSAYLGGGTQSELVAEADSRLQLGITLFYKLIENILENEKNIHKDISAIVENELFYQCMFACSLEIVLDVYKNSRKFPWIIDVLEIQPYDFVKVIELIVRSRDQLSRDSIKHLNMIEETIIECLAWRSNSVLWEAIKNSNKEIPKYEETALPGHLLYVDQNTNGNTNARRPPSNSEPVTSSPLQSPGPSAIDRFQSPVNNTNVNRQLFPSVQAGQSLLQKHTHIMITDKEGNRKLIPVMEMEKPQTQQPQAVQQTEQPKPPTAPIATKPKRTGSLSIIFRKFYNLAGVRMEHLCVKLHLTDIELKRKIWTVFEDSIRNHTELLKDRHLDQLLLCAVYVICKVCGTNYNFTHIMKCYREQPQANSDIYRNVLIRGKQIQVKDTMVQKIPEERRDLIYFYNTIYVDVMKKFALKFSSNSKGGQVSDLLLSPLPASKKPLMTSPCLKYGNVIVQPLYSNSNSNSAGAGLNYFFSRSPSKDLKDINKAINNNAVSGKRLLIDGDLDIPGTKRIAKRKIESLVEERRSQNITE